MIIPTLMLTSAALCVIAACVTRVPITIMAAVIMFAAMVDHTILQLVPGMAWAFVLVLLGVLLAVQHRVGSSQPHAVAPAETGQPKNRVIASPMGVLTSLAYLVMAWLLIKSHVVHRTIRNTDTVIEASEHLHGSSIDFTTAVVLCVTTILVIALAFVAFQAARKWHRLRSLDAAGMGAMLLLMAHPLVMV